MKSKDKRKIPITGLNLLGYSFIVLLLLAIILEIFNHLLPAYVSLGLWILVLLFEIVGVVRKSGKVGDTLSESLVFVSQGYRARRRMIALIGAGIAAKIVSFGWIIPIGGGLWTSLAYENSPLIISKIFLIFVGGGVGIWLWDHFLLALRDG